MTAKIMVFGKLMDPTRATKKMRSPGYGAKMFFVPKPNYKKGKEDAHKDR